MIGQYSCCYGNLTCCCSPYHSILEHVTSESTLSSGSDPLAPSQATKEREKGLFEDRKVCVCVCVCVFVCVWGGACVHVHLCVYVGTYLGGCGCACVHTVCVDVDVYTHVRIVCEGYKLYM